MEENFDEHVEIRKCTISSEDDDSILSIKLPESKINFGDDHNLIPLIFFVRVIKPEVNDSTPDASDSYQISIEVSPTDKSNVYKKPSKKPKKCFGKTKPGLKSGCMRPKTVGSDLSLSNGPKIVYMRFRLMADGDDESLISEAINPCPAEVEECRPTCTSPCCKNDGGTEYKNNCDKSCTQNCSKNLKKCQSLDSMTSSSNNITTDCSNLTQNEPSLQRNPTLSKLNVPSDEPSPKPLSVSSSLSNNDRDPSIFSSETGDMSDEKFSEQDETTDIEIKILEGHNIIILEPSIKTNDLHNWYKKMFESEMNDYHKELELAKNRILDTELKTNNDKIEDEVINIKNSVGMELGLEILEDNINIRVTRQ